MFKQMLIDILSKIKGGEPLVKDKMKVTCSWGLCQNEGVTKGLGEHCPMDRDQSLATSPIGCYHRCHIFQGRLKDRQKAIAYYEHTIERLGV